MWQAEYGLIAGAGILLAIAAGQLAAEIQRQRLIAGLRASIANLTELYHQKFERGSVQRPFDSSGVRFDGDLDAFLVALRELEDRMGEPAWHQGRWHRGCDTSGMLRVGDSAPRAALREMIPRDPFAEGTAETYPPQGKKEP